jgi:hypothetical protein
MLTLLRFNRILDSRVWAEPVGPPALPPPPVLNEPAPPKMNSNFLQNRTSSPAPSFNSKLSFKRDKKKDKEEVSGEEKKKKGLFKMRWD